MATAIAYGSITVVDITDIGEFSVQPMSNLPLTVIYDPDQPKFIPDWSDSNLTITPAVYYAGQPLTLGSTGLTITWALQEGVSGSVDITDSTGAVKPEYVSKGYASTNGKLGVTRNQFLASSTMLTYIVTATYVEPTSSQTLTARGQITFTLARNASSAETCYITGDSIFKYNSSGGITGASSITLTAKVNNVTISEWQYQKSDGTWGKYPNSGTGNTLTVNHNDSTFTSDKCLIRVVTSDPDVYDLHTIIRLRDGAAGQATVSAVLTNDDQMIPFSPSGTGDYSAAKSQVIIYEGGADKTSEWTITQSYDSSIEATASSTTTNNDTVQVTKLTGNTGNVTFTCKKSGKTDIIKVFSLVKVESGADGKSPTVYSVEADALALNRAENETLNPASVTFRSFSQVDTIKSAYPGRMQIFENITLTEYDAASPKPTAKYTSTSDETSYAYSPSTSATSVLCILYEGGALTKRLDSQQVIITKDGKTGEKGLQGDPGNSAINVVLGNYADVLTCTNENKIMSAQTIKIPFAAYEGTTRIPCTFTAVNLLGIAPEPIGTGANSSKNATATSDGQIVWILPANTSVPSASGVLSITFTAETSNGNVPVVANYSWSRNQAAKNGVNAIMLQIFTPNGGNIVSQDIQSVLLRAQLTDGATDVTTQSGITWQWAKFQNGTYTDLTGKTSYELTVNSTDVDSYASYRCTATYHGDPYIAYFSVFDKTDPIQVTVLCSVGTQLINGMGEGAIYAKVSRNGEEIDAMKSERFLLEDPATAKDGDYYYKINSTNKTITLMKYTTSWQPASSSESTYTGTYRWTWRNKDGEVVTTIGGNTLPSEGKIVYIDGSMVDKKIIADVEVEI